MKTIFNQKDNIWTYKIKDSDLIHLIIKDEISQELLYENDCMSIEPIKDYIIIRSKGGYYEIIDFYGRSLLQSHYLEIKHIQSDIFYVSLRNINKDSYDNLCGIINIKNNIIIPIKYHWIKAITYENNIYFIACVQNRINVFDISGKKLMFDTICDFIRIKTNNKNIVFNDPIPSDPRFEFYLPTQKFEYLEVKVFDEIEAIGFRFFKYKIGNEWWIAKSLNHKLPLTPNSIYEEIIAYKNYEDEDDYLESRFLKITENGKIGFIDCRCAVEPQFEDLKFLKKGLYAVKRSGVWGIINQNKEYIISPQYDAISINEQYSDYSNNCFIIKQNNKYGTINQNNELFIPIKYDKIIGNFALIGTIYHIFDAYGEIKEEVDLAKDYSLGYENENSIAFHMDKRKINLFTDEIL